MRDRSTVFIAFCDLLFAVLAVVIVAVAPTHAKVDGVQERALFLITAEWDSAIDADADNHLLLPNGRPVFYGARQLGCVTLDTDNKGLQDSTVKLADGSTAKIKASKETISIRCANAGSYVAAVNLYAYREGSLNQDQRRDLGLKIHCEVVAIEPTVHLVFQKDIVLDRVGETVNWTAFDLDSAGALTLTDHPLTPITEGYSHPNSGSYTPGSTSP